MNHESYMQRCLQLARLGAGSVAPNPMVGCVVVYDNQIIGEGYHQHFGGPHAEVNAICSVKENNRSCLKRATLYVNLEPCAHYGKTPPCVDLIIEKQICRVVIANVDPNPLVAGKGIDKLQQAGIEVISGIMSEEGQKLNQRFFTFHTKKRPYIILKWAQSADGFIAVDRNRQDWITGSEAIKLVHRWRSEEQGILVGKNTILADNPRLNNRFFSITSQPVRMFIDRNLEVDAHFHVLDNTMQTFVFNSLCEKTSGNIEWIKIPFDNVPAEICRSLFKRNIQSLMVEGGAATINSFIHQNLWDEARIITGNVWFGRGIDAPRLPVADGMAATIGKDKLIVVKNPDAASFAD